VEGPTDDSVGVGAEGDREVDEPMEDTGPPAGRRCRRAMIDFLSSTDVGRRVSAENDTVSEVSEAELWEWEEEQGVAAEGMGAEVGTTIVPPHA